METVMVVRGLHMLRISGGVFVSVNESSRDLLLRQGSLMGASLAPLDRSGL